MSARGELEKHAEELSAVTGLKPEVHEEGNRLFVVVPQVALPPGVSRVATTDILFIADSQYPLSAMDMFYTEVEVVRPDGSLFEQSNSIEEYLGRKWRRFSYHRNNIWNPVGNPLLDHYAFMETRFTERALP